MMKIIVCVATIINAQVMSQTENIILRSSSSCFWISCIKEEIQVYEKATGYRYALANWKLSYENFLHCSTLVFLFGKTDTKQNTRIVLADLNKFKIWKQSHSKKMYKEISGARQHEFWKYRRLTSRVIWIALPLNNLNCFAQMWDGCQVKFCCRL